MCSIDDYYMAHLREAACWLGYRFLISTLVRLGWTVNHKKCVSPTQSLVFLGVGITTMYLGVPSLGVFLDAVRLARLRKQCLGVAQAKGGVVPRAMLRSLVGHLTFCAIVLRDARSFTRVGWAVLGDALRRNIHRVKVSKQLREELQSWCRRCSGDFYSRPMDIKPVHTSFGSWDASTSQGMGGYLLGETFAVQWVDFAKKYSGASSVAHYPKFDSSGVPLCSIAMLELFAGFWFLKTWGSKLQGHTVVVHTDNTNVQSMLTKLYGTEEFTPLIIQIRLMCVRWAIDLDVRWISSKDNIMSDALSRNDYPGFLRALAAYELEATRVGQVDRQNWMLCKALVGHLDEQFGPFQVDACCDLYGANAHFRVYWTVLNDAAKMPWDGLRVWCNGPFGAYIAIIRRFLQCKARCPLGTSGMFIIPVWETTDFYRLIKRLPHVFEVVAEWPAGSTLFTAPVLPHVGPGRVSWGVTRWAVQAVWAGPLAVVGGLLEFL